MRGRKNENGKLIANEPMFNEIKFRLHDSDRGVTNVYTLSKLISTTFRRGKFEFRGRFTGLLDKNGKEIYEGDILHNGWVISWNENYPNYGFYQKSKDNWRTGLGVGRPNWKYGFLWNKQNPYSIDRQDLEVIGNIYQNPELLK
jgi:uncharacterized phage protein (TIGR01671 family)